MSNHSTTDEVDVVTAFWRQLRSYLEPQINIDGQDLDGQLDVTINVTSSAPTGPDYPEISFQAPHVTRGNTSGKAPHRFRSTRAELGTISVELRAQSFASYDHSGWTVTRSVESLGTVLNQAVARYRDDLANLGVQGRVGSILDSVDKPSSETTVAQLDSLKDQLKQSVRSVNQLRSEIQSLQSPFSESLDSTRSLAEEACGEVITRLRALESAIPNGYSSIEEATQALNQPVEAMAAMEAETSRLFAYFDRT